MGILPDVLRPDLKLVFCGMAASKKSAEVGAYYAGPGNRFWPILFETGLTSKRLPAHKFRELLQYGYGLTDIAKHQAGNDAELDQSAISPDELRAKIEQFAPRVLAFVGKRAAQEFFGQKAIDYGRQSATIGRTVIFVLPSTSGAARRFWAASHWHTLAGFVKRIP